MFSDLKLCDQLTAEDLAIDGPTRELLKKWGEKWIAGATAAKPGPWIQAYRPQLLELLRTLTFTFENGKLEIVCPVQLKETLILLSRGSTWFNGVDDLELELLGVVMSR